MKQFKRTLIAAILITAFTSRALAGNAPASQFGITDWPYRNPESPCVEHNQPDCSDCNEIPAVTSRPQVTPVITPRPTSAVQVTPAPTNTPGSGDYTTVSVTKQEQTAWNLLNADRKANGLGELVLDEELCRIARIKSCDMKTNNYFAHESPTYGNASAMLTHFGYSFKGAGENIAHHATIEKAQAAFMSSSGHRANILGSQWTRVGIGICYDDQGYIYLTQIFVR